MRILVIEDDEKIASFIIKGLREAGFTVDHAQDGITGGEMALSGLYDAAVVDIMLPHKDGLSIIDEARRKNVKLPVIILSAKRSVEDRIKGLETGGDDYLTKPFSFAELLARLQALLRRTIQTDDYGLLTIGDLSINIGSQEVTREGQRIDLQPLEFKLLFYLMKNAGRVLPKTMILDHVWGYDFDPQTNVVDVLVCRLRGKVDRPFDKGLIRTIRGVGYVVKES